MANDDSEVGESRGDEDEHDVLKSEKREQREGKGNSAVILRNYM